MIIRLFRPEDAEQIAHLFHDTIHAVNLGDYSPAQIQAWAPDDLYFRDWETVCGDRLTYVAEATGQILGFGELKPEGQIDCFYCHQDHIGKGVGTRIYQAIETQAKALKLSTLTVDASITAKPFFQKMGFAVIRSQQVQRRGETLTNYRMQKFLTPTNDA
jgi:GNAT superfamily N-acetyltransferase